MTESRHPSEVSGEANIIKEQGVNSRQNYPFTKRLVILQYHLKIHVILRGASALNTLRLCIY